MRKVIEFVEKSKGVFFRCSDGKILSCGKTKVLTIELRPVFLSKHTKDEIITLFTKIDWSRLDLLCDLHLHHESFFLAPYIPPSIKKICFFCYYSDCRRPEALSGYGGLHTIKLISAYVKEVTFLINYPNQFDSTLFERLPVQIEKINIVFVLTHEVGYYGRPDDEHIDFIYKRGFHNLPICLKKINIQFNSRNDGRTELTKKQIENIKKSITYGPCFTSLMIDDVEYYS